MRPYCGPEAPMPSTRKRKRKPGVARVIRFPAERSGGEYESGTVHLAEGFGECKRSQICREFQTDLADGLCQKHWDSFDSA